MLNQLTRKQEPHPKKSFWASDFSKPGLEIWAKLKGFEETNPPEWYDYAKFGAGKGAELELLQTLKDSGIVDESYDQDEHGRVETEFDGVPFTGSMDAVSKNGNIIEIKTINNKNTFDIRSYESGKPRENYVGQLAFYMEAQEAEKGALFVVSIDGLHRFWLECRRTGDKKYRCGEVEVDLAEEIERFKLIMALTDHEEPPEELVWEYRYKYPIDDMDWTKVSANDISKARNGHKVLGDWKVQYSPYKDWWVKLQGEELGYSPEEIEKIKEATKGYTKK